MPLSSPRSLSGLGRRRKGGEPPTGAGRRERCGGTRPRCAVRPGLPRGRRVASCSCLCRCWRSCSLPMCGGASCSALIGRYAWPPRGALAILGWALARNLGRMLQPRLAQRIDPGAAGVVGFMVRLVTLVAIVLVSLRLAGLRPGTLALGRLLHRRDRRARGTADGWQRAGRRGPALGLARFFRSGTGCASTDMAWTSQANVAAHGLLYLSLTDGGDLVQRAELHRPRDVQPSHARAGGRRHARAAAPRAGPRTDPGALDRRHFSPHEGTATRGSRGSWIDDAIVVRIRAKPDDDRQGGRLAGEVLAALTSLRG